VGQTIDGKAVAAVVRAEVRERVARLAARGIVPGLAAILVGDDPASQVYVGNKERACADAGIRSFRHRLPASMPEGELLALVGRSVLVGKPVALLLLERHATVTLCHSRTTDLPGEVRRAALVIAATGQPGLIRGEWIRPGAVVIDVGINRGADGKLCGDVEFEPARERAAFITPVPGGVGPMTVAMLLANTVTAAERAAAARAA